MKVDVKNFDGATVEEFELRDDIFGIEPNTVVMHQALVRLGFRAIRAKGGRRESDFVRLLRPLNLSLGNRESVHVLFYSFQYKGTLDRCLPR